MVFHTASCRFRSLMLLTYEERSQRDLTSVLVLEVCFSQKGKVTDFACIPELLRQLKYIKTYCKGCERILLNLAEPSDKMRGLNLV